MERPASIAILTSVAAALLLPACRYGEYNQAPKAFIAVTQSAPDQLTSFVFSSSASSDADGRIVGTRWDFGDGNISFEASPSHAYGASGKYLVTLTVTDDDGASAQAIHPIEIDTPAVSVAASSSEFSVVLPDVATIEAPPAAFPAPTRVGVWATSSPATAAGFALAAQMFPNALRAAHEIRVNSGAVAPTSVLSAVVHVPPELLERLREHDEPHVFVQAMDGSGKVELVDSLYDVAAQTLRFELAPTMFSRQHSSDASWEAVIVVGSTRTRSGAGESSSNRFAQRANRPPNRQALPTIPYNALSSTSNTH